MVKGIGTDIIEISKIKNIHKRWGDKALKRVFTDNEIKYCNSVRYRFRSFGARFAAKEAVLKAIGNGLNNDSGTQRSWTWKDIEIVKEKSGKPEVKFRGKIKALFKKLKLNNIEISISHCDNFAVAVAIIGR